MLKRNIAFALLLATGFSCAMSYAGLLFSTGHPLPTWLEPKPWSKDLERSLAKTDHRGQFLQYDDRRETVFEIQFNGQENFEELWPSILSLKSKGAPLILRKGPSSYRKRDAIMSGVHIVYPLRDEKGLSNPGIDPKVLEIFLSSPDTLPEYVKSEGGDVIPLSGAVSKDPPLRSNMPTALYRVRTDIILVVDGNVVDLNRIPLPSNTPIIDQRFNMRIQIDLAKRSAIDPRR